MHKDGRKPGKPTASMLDVNLDDEGVVEIFLDSDDCQDDDDDYMETSTSSSNVFGSASEVFVVRGLSKAVSGFRPAVTCEGFLAHVSRTSSGYTLLPRGSDQQLSFKYEPPSPKFSGKRPSCISYRVQLLHGSQFLYSLRGLPKTLRCQRATHALEWGPVHMVFAAASDLDAFVSTMKYVDVVEVSPEAEGPRQSGGHTGCVSTSSSTSSRTSSTSTSAAGSGRHCGCGAAARHGTAATQRKDGHRGHGPTTMAASPCAPCACQPHGSPVFAATAGAAVLAAVAAACLLTQRGGAMGIAPPRKRVAESPAHAAA